MGKYSKILKLVIIILFIITLIKEVKATDVSDSSVVLISARVNDITQNGGGSTGSISIQTTVNFSGIAYPNSNVYLLQDGVVVATVKTNNSPNFSISIQNLNTNVYTFSLYAEDTAKRKSSFYSFPLYLTSGITVNISNIFLSPTIALDKIRIKLGDNLTIFGKSAPRSEVHISVLGNQEYFYKVMSNNDGNYFYNFNTSMIGAGKFQTKSNSIYQGRVSIYNSPLVFIVNNENTEKEESICSLIRADLNCDGHVNLTDFSIMAFWYKKIKPPVRIDLKEDGIINLIDFSILAFYWTG